LLLTPPNSIWIPGLTGLRDVSLKNLHTAVTTKRLTVRFRIWFKDSAVLTMPSETGTENKNVANGACQNYYWFASGVGCEYSGKIRFASESIITKEIRIFFSGNPTP
jgi:hypothetical protein